MDTSLLLPSQGLQSFSDRVAAATSPGAQSTCRVHFLFAEMHLLSFFFSFSSRAVSPVHCVCGASIVIYWLCSVHSFNALLGQQIVSLQN